MNGLDEINIIPNNKGLFINYGMAQEEGIVEWVARGSQTFLDLFQGVMRGGGKKKNWTRIYIEECFLCTIL